MQSQFRSHFKDGVTIVALAKQLGENFFEARVGEPKGDNQVAAHITCDSLEAAQIRADERVQDAYPHDCSLNGCADWRDFAGSVSP